MAKKTIKTVAKNVAVKNAQTVAQRGIAMMQRPGGATSAQLMKHLGWTSQRPHFWHIVRWMAAEKIDESMYRTLPTGKGAEIAHIVFKTAAALKAFDKKYSPVIKDHYHNV
jgi:hypothetical protein